jgi:hypothetical protein
VSKYISTNSDVGRERVVANTYGADCKSYIDFDLASILPSQFPEGASNVAGYLCGERFEYFMLL